MRESSDASSVASSGASSGASMPWMSSDETRVLAPALL